MTSLIKVVSPICDLKADELQSQIVLSGALQVTDTVNTFQSYQLSPSLPISALITINPPSNQTIINRRILIRSYIQFDFSAPVQIGTNDSLACLPFNNMIDVATLTINGESTSENISDKLSALMCFGNTPEDRNKTLSLTASMPDQYQSYSDWSVYGTNRSPLAYYGEVGYETPRGGFPFVQVSPTRYQFEIVEPLFLSPLDPFGTVKEGMTNVNQLSINLRFKADCSRAWSHSSLGNLMTGVTVTFYRPPEALVQYSTPAMLERLPLVQNLPYVKANEYVKSMPILASNAVTTITSDTIRLSQIPKAIYLFCRRSDATTDFTTPQSFLSIENISVNWANQSSLFSQTTKQGLFEMASNHGYNVPYAGWAKHRGSVVKIVPCIDLGTLDSESVGVQGSYNLQVQLTARNTSSSNFEAQFYICVVNEGLFSIGQNSARSSLGNLTPAMVLSAKEEKDPSPLSYEDYVNMSGGSFWSSLKRVVGKVARAVNTVAKPLSGVLPPQYGSIAQGVGNVSGALADALGAGAYVGAGTRVGGAMPSSRLVGGRKKR